MQPDTSVFPNAVYQDTVLEPLFDGAKAHYVEAFQAIDRAHLVMLAQTEILAKPLAQQIARALREIDQEIDPKTLVYTGEVEDYFFAREQALKEKLGVDVGGRLHTARSRNDMDHTVFKLTLKRYLNQLLEEVFALIESLLAKAQTDSATLIVAYTHGQPAQPTTLGHYLAALIEILLRDVQRLLAARGVVNLSSMGAAAITTSGFPIDRHLVAELLGFAAPQCNSYGCIAAVDYISATYSAIELLFLHLGRFIQDLQFQTAFEVAQLYVPNAFVQISSIMPQKRNPVPIEHLRHLSSQTVGRARMMLDILHNTPFTDMNDSEGETQAAGYQVFHSASRVLRLLAALVPALQVNEAQVQANMDRACITITELADGLVREENLSFRQAHEIAAAVAKAVVAEKGSLSAMGYQPFCRAFREIVGRDSEMEESTFKIIVSPKYFVAVRDQFGGPAEGAMFDALYDYQRQLSAYRQRQVYALADEAEAKAKLDAQFAKLLEG